MVVADPNPTPTGHHGWQVHPWPAVERMQVR
jgi:hypothetical protein